MPLDINGQLSIPDGEIAFAFIRSAGPGGQNVNKVATAVQLRFDLAHSVLPQAAQQRLRQLAGRRLNDDGTVLITARSHRSQERNREEALERLRALIRAALAAPKPRRPTRPTFASRQRRLQAKAHDQKVKRLRGRVRED
ncbi:MAG TPA: alternative ribosome rescue aminoacyl-tRNA hydrolase ArfB [Steroidobacteraceae bacterium]|nr:alternative ribosome rescue aminoacyl-tRNA hydrolase ArfB [Steroidobacteraceae bacterium]